MALVAPPMAVGVDIDVDKFEVEKLLSSAVYAAAHPASMEMFGERAADYLEERTATRFVNEGDDAAGRWLPLRPATERIRVNLGYEPDGPINVRTTELFQWAVYSADVQPIPGGVEITKPDIDSMPESAVEKLVTAQQGRDSNPMIPGATTPPRPVVALSEADAVALVKELQLHIMHLVVRGVGG